MAPISSELTEATRWASWNLTSLPCLKKLMQSWNAKNATSVLLFRGKVELEKLYQQNMRWDTLQLLEAASPRHRLNGKFWLVVQSWRLLEMLKLQGTIIARGSESLQSCCLITACQQCLWWELRCRLIYWRSLGLCFKHKAKGITIYFINCVLEEINILNFCLVGRNEGRLKIKLLHSFCFRSPRQV